MRKYLALLLLAGAALPAVAMAGPPVNPDSDEARSERAERQQARSERSAERPHPGAALRAERSGGDDSARIVRGDRGNAPATELRRQRSSDGNEAPNASSGGGGNPARAIEFRRQRLGGSPQIDGAGQAVTAGDAPETIRNGRRSQRQQTAMPRMVEPPRTGVIEQAREGRRLRQHDRAVPNVLRSRIPVVSQTPREGTQPPLRAQSHRRSSNWASWNHNWRNDHRYDWRNHRHRHRSLFHLGFYFDPFGWSYRPYSIGWRLWPSYYSSSRYWLSDPYQYRLPYAPPGTRWVRYYNDAILVDTWTGEVVDVIYNFFW